MTELTQEHIRFLFTYRDGNLYWKNDRCNRQIKAGDEAGGLDNGGYYRIRINGKNYQTHRLIFLYHKGYLPKYLDHIDRDKQNNNISNLRPITRNQNMMNRKPNKNSLSQYKGVCWNKREKKWFARIKINCKGIYLGHFKNELDAALAYNAKATELFGEYAYLNKIGDNR